MARPLVPSRAAQSGWHTGPMVSRWKADPARWRRAPPHPRRVGIDRRIFRRWVSRSAEECRPGPDVTLEGAVTACRERAHATDAMIRSLALRGHRSRIAGLKARIPGG